LQSILHPEKSLEEFNKILTQIHYYVMQYGIDKFKPSLTNSIEGAKFMMVVHEGWKIAQDLIIKELLCIQDEISLVTEKIKEHNKNKRKEQSITLKKVIEILELRSLKLKKAIDAIVWQVFQFEDHLLKRLYLEKTISNINRKTLIQTLTFIDSENQKAGVLAICCDLSTFIHVGDVIHLDLINKKLSLIELKEGKKNHELTEILDSSYGIDYLLSLSEDDKKQLERMSKQRWRMSQFELVAKGEQATCIKTNKAIHIPEERRIIDTYESEIVDMYKILMNGKSWAINTIDKCLHIGLYKDHQMAIVFKAWMAAMKVDSAIIDYLNVFSIPLACPPFSQSIPSDLILKLSTGEIKLMYCLDIPLWIDAMNNLGGNEGKFTLETLKKSRKIQLEAQGEMLEYKEKIIKFQNKDAITYVGSGILLKILFRYYRPISVLKEFLTQSIR